VAVDEPAWISALSNVKRELERKFALSYPAVYFLTTRIYRHGSAKRALILCLSPVHLAAHGQFSSRLPTVITWDKHIYINRLNECELKSKAD